MSLTRRELLIASVGAAVTPFIVKAKPLEEAVATIEEGIEEPKIVISGSLDVYDVLINPRTGERFIVESYIYERSFDSPSRLEVTSRMMDEEFYQSMVHRERSNSLTMTMHQIVGR